MATSRATRPFRWFTPLLAVLLGGYMFFGRPFAYLSLPGAPAYIGDMVLAVGLVEAVRARSAIRAALAASPPLKFLLAFMVVCGLRFLVGFPTYRLDAVRDSAIWYYGVFAFLVAGAALCDPTFTPRLLGWYRRIIPVFFAWAPIAVVLSRMPSLGFVPGTVSSINGFVPGDIALHTAIAIAFLWLGLDRAVGRSSSQPSSQLLVPLGLVGFLVAGTQNRGGFLAGLCVLGVAFCCMRSGGRRRALVSGVCSFAVVALLMALLNVRIQLATADRELSLQQIGANVTSVLDPDSGDASDSGNLQANVDWRLQYWDAVKQDALSPSYILNGRGFGPILAFEYGIDAPREGGNPPLRSAHNTHLTILARTGIPGAALWALLWLVWFRHVVRWGVRGRVDPERRAQRVGAGGRGRVSGQYVLRPCPGWPEGRYLDLEPDGIGSCVRSQEPVGGAEQPRCQLRRAAEQARPADEVGVERPESTSHRQPRVERLRPMVLPIDG